MSREITALKGHYADQLTGEPRTDNILKTVGVMVGATALFVLVRKVAR